MIESYVRNSMSIFVTAAFICVILCVHLPLTSSFALHNSFVRAIWHIHVCDRCIPMCDVHMCDGMK